MNLLDSTCTLCPAGTYSDTNGAIGSCTTCPAGTFSIGGASTCTLCPGGTYSTVGAAESCTACPAGTYSADGATNCTACPAGQNSFAGFSSCFASEIFDGQLFVIQSPYTSLYLSLGSPQTPYPLTNYRGNIISLTQAPELFAYSDSTLFTYNSTTMQIYNPASNLCLDDLRHGYSALSSVSDSLAFTSCSSSKTQQFAYFPSTKYILNPNNPYDKCLDGNTQYPEVFLSLCPYDKLNHQWDFILSCMPGTIHLKNCLRLQINLMYKVTIVKVHPTV